VTSFELDADILAYYDRGAEAGRLAAGEGRIELLRTRDILRRELPPAPATVLDVGGGTGVYARWLAELGHRVTVVDPVPGHVRAAAAQPGVAAVTGDARALPAPDASADAVLLLGPLYHLVERADRVRALAEARRAVRPGGLVAAALISRFAAMHSGWAEGKMADPRFRAIAAADLAGGVHRNDTDEPGYFTTAYFHRPDEAAGEAADAGLIDARLVAVEGVAGWLAPLLEDDLRDPERREHLLGLLRTVESEPSLLGASPHLLLLTRRP
jgi:ubiquinone/menaquinone biosynthesis C-methylase UbiE